MAWNEFRQNEVLAMALYNLRTKINVTRYIDFRSSDLVSQLSDTLTIPIAGDMTDSAVSPTASPYAATNPTDKQAKIVLSEHRRADFVITDKDLNTSRQMDIIRTHTAAAADALATRLSEYIFSRLVSAPADVHRTLLSSGTKITLNAIVDARTKLNKRKVPVGTRSFILGPTGEADLLKDDDFNRADTTGSGMTRMSGEIGTVMGFTVVGNNPSAISPSNTGMTTSHTVDGAVGKGGTVVVMDGGTKQPLVGATFAMTSSGTVYTVTATEVVTAGSKWRLEFSPPAANATDFADNATVNNVGPATDVSFAIQQQAVSLVMCPLMTPNTNNNLTQSISDPETGIQLRLEVTRQNKQTLYTLDWLYGASLVREECVQRIERRN